MFGLQPVPQLFRLGMPLCKVNDKIGQMIDAFKRTCIVDASSKASNRAMTFKSL